MCNIEYVITVCTEKRGRRSEEETGEAREKEERGEVIETAGEMEDEGPVQRELEPGRQRLLRTAPTTEEILLTVKEQVFT